MITRAEKGTRGWRKPMQNGGAGIREIRILTLTSIERVSQSRYRIRCSGDLRIERRGHFHCHGSQLVVRRFVSEGLTQNLAYALVSLSSRNDMSPPRADGPTQARCSDRVSSHHSDHQVKFATMASHPKIARLGLPHITPSISSLSQSQRSHSRRRAFPLVLPMSSQKQGCRAILTRLQVQE